MARFPRIRSFRAVVATVLGTALVGAAVAVSFAPAEVDRIDLAALVSGPDRDVAAPTGGDASYHDDDTSDGVDDPDDPDDTSGDDRPDRHLPLAPSYGSGDGLVETMPAGPGVLAPAPAPEGAAADGRLFADWCTPDQVVQLDGGGDAASGKRMHTIRAVNVGSTPCVLEGYPDIAFAGADGRELAVTLVRGGSSLTTDAGPTRIELQPGTAAVARLGWGSMATSTADIAVTLVSALYPGAERGSWPLSADIIEGGEVSVTAWEFDEATGW